MLEARDLGKAVRQLRGERSHESLAQRAGIDPALLERYEAGREMPPRQALIRLCEALEISEAEMDLHIIDYWRRRIGTELPGSLEAKRLELFERVKALGGALDALVNTLDEMLTLGEARPEESLS